MRRTTTARMTLAASMLLMAGCSTTNPFDREKLMVPVGPSFVAGRGLQLYPTSAAIVTNVQEAMADLGMRSIHQVPEPNGLTALEATTADRRPVRVTIQTTGVRSLLSAKVGWFGDEPLTRALLDRVGTRQGTIEPPPLAEEPPPAEPGSNPFVSRSAVPDSVMLRHQLDAGFAPTISPP